MLKLYNRAPSLNVFFGSLLYRKMTYAFQICFEKSSKVSTKLTAMPLFQVCLFYWNVPIIEFLEACLILPLINCQGNVIANRKSIDGGQLRPCRAILSDMIIDALELRPMTEQQTWASLSLAVIDVSKMGFIMHISFGPDSSVHLCKDILPVLRIQYWWVSII